MSVTWFVPRSDLSPDQLRAVELPMRDHALVLGAPGSGKTLVLLHRAKRLIEEEGISSDRLRIFVFTNSLKGYIRSALGVLDIPANCVMTFDYWCREFYTTFVSSNVPFAGRKPDFDKIRQGVLDKLRGGVSLATLPSHGDLHDLDLFGDDEQPPSTSPQVEFPEFFAESIGCPIYDVALVDEGQDLTPESFEILKRLARHVTVCMDSRQQLYEERSDEKDLLATLGLRRCNLTILGAYRCCPYITELAASLLSDAAERQIFLNQTRTAQRERLTPLLYIAADANEEKNRLAQIIKDRLTHREGDRIAVLFPDNAKLFSMARILTEAGLEVEVPPQRRKSSFPEHDFQSERPKLMTYYGAKGLTFETVIMPRLVPNSFQRISPERLAKLLFVGITRATQWVYMSTVEGPMLPVVLQMIEKANDGIISIQRSDNSQPLFNSGNERQKPISLNAVDPLTDLL